VLDRGTIVAGYRIDGLLAVGGMAVVYRATQLSLNRVAALKVLASELSDDPVFRERFRREGQLQAAIDHPHIVTVYEAGQTEHGLFLAMRVVRGPTLKDLILSGELEAGRALRLLTQVADALDAAHDVGLIHRDVKPQNILVGARDHAYLADFGLTKAPGKSGLTEEGQFVGTIDYVSPEQARGETATDRSDVYALAAVLCECLSGQVPFPKPNEPAVLYAHMSEPPPRLSERRSELPRALDDVVAQGMAKDPDARPRSATELMREVARAFPQAAAAAEAAPPAASAEETRPRPVDDPADPRGTTTQAAAVREATATHGRAAPAGAQPSGPGPNAAYAAALTRATEQLSTSRASAARRLRGASAPEGQASAAADLAAAYGQASRDLARATTSPVERAANAHVAAALAQIADAYARAAAAARQGDAGAYAAAGLALSEDEAALARAFDALEALGYTVER
jgi:serine/threonine-protein kinase